MIPEGENEAGDMSAVASGVWGSTIMFTLRNESSVSTGDALSALFEKAQGAPLRGLNHDDGPTLALQERSPLRARTKAGSPFS